MTHEHALDPTIELRLATRRTTLSIHDLATQLRLPVTELRGALLTILLASRPHAEVVFPYPTSTEHTFSAPEGEPTEGEERTRRNERTRPDIYFETKRSFVARETTVIHTQPDFAHQLATALDNIEALTTYRHLAEQHPFELLTRALGITLRAPRERIRGTRGAYFMGVVAVLAKTSPSAYARSSSPST